MELVEYFKTGIRQIAELQEQADNHKAELTRLRAIEAALPKTRDGVAIVPRMKLWYRDPIGGRVRRFTMHGTSPEYAGETRTFYSTEAALLEAEAAVPEEG